MLDQPLSQRHLDAAARPEEAAIHHDLLAARFVELGDLELAELERRGAAYAREGAARGRVATQGQKRTGGTKEYGRAARGIRWRLAR